MSTLKLLALMLALGVSAPEFDRTRVFENSKSENHSNTLRVATWNIDRGTELDKITEELRKNPVDLLLLQEVDWNAKRSGNKDETAELARALNLNGVFATEFEELSQEDGDRHAFIGQATLTDLKVQSSRVLRFKNQSGFWKPRSWMPSNLPLMQRRLGSRIALVTDLKWRGSLLVVYNAHLESRSYGRIQAEQLDEILADANRYPAGTAFVLSGDLNTKYFPSVFLHKLEKAGFHSAMGEKIERTHAIAMALDWIFAKGPITAVDGKVRKDLKGSDHYALYATIEAH